ncbi:MAG TPA: KUP/HAK/KT family potassium transporter [Polyangiaceae bacterium]|nr:KUP/HAK/KT family potassium transporter [Polyangiaceae bacterium]
MSSHAHANESVANTAPGHAHGSPAGLVSLSLGALGVVYGDIGTSPLYALKECVHGPHAVAPTDANIQSLLSLMFWSVTLVVGVKYLGYITRADNEGEGGILALLALLPKRHRERGPGRLGFLVALLLFGAALLYGDGVITPAMSVLSAVEGLRVATDVFDPLVVPITVAILLGLFVAQKHGTTVIGRIFGPVMLLWFSTLALLGALAIAQHPSVLGSLNPWYAVSFFAREPLHAFLILGSVVLCITGAEALYADMGHFGRHPIQAAWYFVVYPGLICNYFGQGAELMAAPIGPARLKVAENPFYSLAPGHVWVLPLVALSTLATVIASQALISGAFSLTRQAAQLGYWPRVTIKHTSSETEGQIYIASVNWLLAIGCIALVLQFKESSRLAAAYGIAVTGTMGITSIAFFNVARERWRWSTTYTALLLGAFLLVDVAFLASNAVKFFDGGFLPVVLAFAIFAMMRTWKRGRDFLRVHFVRNLRPLDEFLAGLARRCVTLRDGAELPVARVPGAAVFLTSPTDGVPPLLLHHVRHVRALHEKVILITVTTARVPRVVESRRFEYGELAEGLARLTIHSGYMQTVSIPQALEAACLQYGIDLDLSDVTYFLGRETLLARASGDMGGREEELFAFMSRNAVNATRYFDIPPERVVEVGMQIDL